jgi:hypothetical protein
LLQRVVADPAILNMSRQRSNYLLYSAKLEK